MLHQEPSVYGLPRTRWRLADLRTACPWLALESLGGLSRLLERLGIRHKRARAYLHSPDPAYAAKVAYLEQCLQHALAAPGQVLFFYLDEFAFERQPSLASAYAARGSKAPLARHTQASNTQCRGLGAVNALTGQLTYCQRSHITTAVLRSFYQQLQLAYPDAQTLYVVQDNWPVHAHPHLLAALQPQRSPFWPSAPPNWPSLPPERGQAAGLPIQLIFLPTYAPWLNPIEKLWPWLRQDVLHLHQLSDHWALLKQRVLAFMAQFAQGSLALLHYIGLLPH